MCALVTGVQTCALPICQSGAFRIGSLYNFRDDRSDNKFTPTAGFTFALNDDVNVYAKYARGFNSGGWNTDFLNVGQIATGFDFDTETVDSYETGLKGLVLDRRDRKSTRLNSSH